MTRFKEGRRIEAALKNRDASELNWAAGYCEMRLSIASRKEHVKHWQAIYRKVKTLLEAAEH